MKPTLIVFLLIALFGCGPSTTEAPAEKQAPPPPLSDKDKYVQRIGGYDVGKYQIEKDDLEMPYQKMTKHHLVCLAVEECDTSLLRQLLQDGANANMICDEDHAITILAYCDEVAVAMTKMMAAAGSDLNGTDGSADPFLHYAVGIDNLDLVRYLIEQGVKTDLRDENQLTGCTVIHGVESLAMLKYLQSIGIDISSRCNNGRTLLHYAARSGHTEIVRYVLEHDLIDKQVNDNEGKSPFDYATRANHDEAAELLR